MEGTMSEVRIFAGNFAPLYWMFCNGSLLSISEYTALFALLSTTYGGDGQVTFALPDLRGRAPVGTGNPTGGVYSWDLGEMSGTEQVTMLSSNMPAHIHTYSPSIKVSSANATTSTPDAVNNTIAALTSDGGTAFGMYNNVAPNVPIGASSGNPTVTGVAGASQPIPIMQPFLALNYIICVEGIFPSRS